jgi:hypothetical protein
MEKVYASICEGSRTCGQTIGAVSRTLWSALGGFTTSDTRIVLPTMHLAQLFR